MKLNNNYYEQRTNTPIRFMFTDDKVEHSHGSAKWDYEHCVENGKCMECGEDIGQVWYQYGDTDGCHWYPYHQLDEDGEYCLCEYCFNEREKDIN